MKETETVKAGAIIGSRKQDGGTGADPVPVNLLKLAEDSDYWLAKKAANFLANPSEEIVLTETEEAAETFAESPVERRYRGHHLFRATVPAKHGGKASETWAAALLEDGQLLFWREHTPGTVITDRISPEEEYHVALNDHRLHPAVWSLALRLLGKPLR